MHFKLCTVDNSVKNGIDDSLRLITSFDRFLEDSRADKNGTPVILGKAARMAARIVLICTSDYLLRHLILPVPSLLPPSLLILYLRVRLHQCHHCFPLSPMASMVRSACADRLPHNLCNPKVGRECHMPQYHLPFLLSLPPPLEIPLGRAPPNFTNYSIVITLA